MPLLADTAYLVAPASQDAPPLDHYKYTFENIANTFDALIDVLGLERMFLYVHDYGAGVASQLATRWPERVLGLIVQNGTIRSTLGGAVACVAAHLSSYGNRSAAQEIFADAAVLVT